MSLEEISKLRVRYYFFKYYIRICMWICDECW